MPTGNTADFGVSLNRPFERPFDRAMGSRALSRFSNRRASRAALGGLLAGAIMLGAGLASAQDAAKPAPQASPPSQQQQGFFGTLGRWWEQATDNFNAGMTGTRDKFKNLGQEAGDAARATVDNAKSAADAVARLPSARVVRGHEKCKNAPNGAPDCVAATVALCKSKGFDNGGSSLDMTTADVCPAQVYLSGRNAGEGCRTETFVSRALCQ
jgi:hypothetical protein